MRATNGQVAAEQDAGPSAEYRADFAWLNELSSRTGYRSRFRRSHYDAMNWMVRLDESGEDVCLQPSGACFWRTVPLVWAKRGVISRFRRAGGRRRRLSALGAAVSAPITSRPRRPVAGTAASNRGSCRPGISFLDGEEPLAGTSTRLQARSRRSAVAADPVGRPRRPAARNCRCMIAGVCELS